MPIYDYVCSACGHRMEVVHGIHGRGPEHCPVCGGAMRKAFVAPAVHFKGSGWAKKDRGAAHTTKAAAKAGPADAGAADTGGRDGSAHDAAAHEGTGKGGSGTAGPTAASSGGDD